MRLIFLMATMAATACSIAKPHQDLAQVASAARITDEIEITPTYRWVLPPLSEINLKSSGAKHAHRLEAAREGLSQSFRLSAAAPYQMLVHWPDAGVARDTPSTSSRDTPSTSSASSGWGIELLPLKDVVPLPAERERLIVDIMDASGQHWVQRLEVEVNPWWFGDDWHDPRAIAETFAAVGRTLTGS